MQANQKPAATEGTRKEVLQSVGANNKERKSMSKDDVKFVGELGWLSAAAVLVAGVAASI
jgi:hypothetical protein